MASPWAPSGNPDYRLVRIKTMPTIQTEFRGRSGGKSFSEHDCALFGSDRSHITAELSLSAVEGSMHVGIFLCDGLDSESGKCVTNKSPTPNITTTMTVFKRQATVLTARSNLTTTELSDLTPPERVSFTTADIDAYKSALS